MTILGSRFTPDYRWNPNAGATGRYIDRRGRFVPAETVTREMERVIAGTKREMQDISKQLQRGEIGLQDWYDGMRGRIKTIHNLSAAVAKGGWAQMSYSDWGFVGSQTKPQYQYLNNFAAEILSGKQALDGRLLVRAGMYADAARRTGEQIKRRMAADKSELTHERRILGAAEHCTSQGGLTGCLELAALGWQPIFSLPPIGNTPCRTNCHCHFQYGQLQPNGEILPIG